MRRYEVRITRAAEHDAQDIYDFIAAASSQARAEAVLARLSRSAQDLATFPNRGALVKELARLGIKEYRQVFFKPYRIIYRVIGPAVYVYLIVDGRRNMQSMLERRLLGA